MSDIKRIRAVASVGQTDTPAKLDFCYCCADWIGADSGEIRKVSGEVVIICSSCLALEANRACLLQHDFRSGTLNGA